MVTLKVCWFLFVNYESSNRITECRRVDRDERYVSLPQSEVVTRALQHVNGLLCGGQAGQTPGDEGRVGEGAQRWGANMSLTHPPIRQFPSVKASQLKYCEMLGSYA